MIISHRPTKPTGKPHDHSTMAWRSSDSRLATRRLHSSEVTLMWDTNKLCVLVYCLHGSAPTCHSACRWSHFTAIIIFICPAGVGNATYTIISDRAFAVAGPRAWNDLYQTSSVRHRALSNNISRLIYSVCHFAILQRLGGVVVGRWTRDQHQILLMSSLSALLMTFFITSTG